MPQFTFRTSMVSSSRRPDLIDEWGDRVGTVLVSLYELSTVQEALRDKTVEVDVEPARVGNKLIQLANHLVYAHDPNLEEIATFMSNSSRPDDNYWQPTNHRFLHPIDYRTLICVSYEEDTRLWWMLSIWAEPT